MPVDTIRVGVVGAGETGTPLLRQLLAADFVDVVGVADLDQEAPGMKLARAHARPTTDDFEDIAALGEGVDILIDTTGVAFVRDRLRERMQATGNRHTIIMHERIAVLMMSLSQGHLVATKHGVVDYESPAALGASSAE
jgi:3-hydroxyisobutyrate dehydrogenase-like beta-hydroxyacid dehydrogenase